MIDIVSMKGEVKRKALGTDRIAQIFHETQATVDGWIKEGMLPSYSTGGGHQKVRDVDLITFLEAHNIPVPEDLFAPDLLRILVVDDEPLTRRLIKRVIGQRFPDAEIHEAADGFEAGEKITQLSPCLVLLDLRLPGLDGLKVCQMIRSNRKLKGVKIIAMTANGLEETKRKLLKAGADDFLAKPFDLEDLVGKVEKLISAATKG